MLLAGTGDGGSYIGQAVGAAVKLGKTQEDIAFDADGIDNIIHRLEKVIDMQAQRHSGAMARASEPGEADDYSSTSYSQASETFSENYDTWNQEYILWLEETIEKFKKVKQNYLAREDDIGEQFRSGANGDN